MPLRSRQLPPGVIRSPTPNVASQCCRDLHLPSIVWGFANVSNALSLVELVACGIKQHSRYQIWTVVSGMQDMCIRSRDTPPNLALVRHKNLASSKYVP